MESSPSAEATSSLAIAGPGGWTLLSRSRAGASGVVFQATRDGVVGALKVAHAKDAWIGHEATLAARVGPRWGPALLDTGHLGGTLHAFGKRLHAGARWLATS